jgi:hypothetical protein
VSLQFFVTSELWASKVSSTTPFKTLEHRIYEQVHITLVDVTIPCHFDALGLPDSMLWRIPCPNTLKPLINEFMNSRTSASQSFGTPTLRNFEASGFKELAYITPQNSSTPNFRTSEPLLIYGHMSLIMDILDWLRSSRP